MKKKVSAVIITFNESYNLQRTLKQLYWCDEIIIVDSNSTDNSINICHEYDCKIYYKDFNGYGEQKNYAISKAKNDWVLCIDADEYLTQELIHELIKELENTGENRGYQIPMNLVFRGHEFKYGRESYRHYTRLFDKRYCTISMRRVHESFQITGTVKKLNNIILHYSYINIHQFITKLNSYSTLGAEINVQNRKRKPQLLIYISLPFYFFKYYFFDGNFLNGKNGFYWSTLSAFYHYAKYLKMQDIQTDNSLKITSLLNNSLIESFPSHHIIADTAS